MSALSFPQKGAPRPSVGLNAGILVEGRYAIIYEPADYGLFVIAIAHHWKKPEDWLNRENN